MKKKYLVSVEKNKFGDIIVTLAKSPETGLYIDEMNEEDKKKAIYIGFSPYGTQLIAIHPEKGELYGFDETANNYPYVYDGKIRGSICVVIFTYLDKKWIILVKPNDRNYLMNPAGAINSSIFYNYNLNSLHRDAAKKEVYEETGCNINPDKLNLVAKVLSPRPYSNLDWKCWTLCYVYEYDVSNCDVSNCNVSNCNVSNCNVSNYDVSNCNVSNYDVSNYDVSNYDVSNCNVYNCDVSNCDVSNCDVSNCDVSNCDVSNIPKYILEKLDTKKSNIYTIPLPDNSDYDTKEVSDVIVCSEDAIEKLIFDGIDIDEYRFSTYNIPSNTPVNGPVTSLFNIDLDKQNMESDVNSKNNGNDTNSKNDGNDTNDTNNGNDTNDTNNGNDTNDTNNGNDTNSKNNGNDTNSKNNGNDTNSKNDGNDNDTNITSKNKIVLTSHHGAIVLKALNKYNDEQHKQLLDKPYILEFYWTK
jgi:uncharacterized protein YjbI with pentapeptide repeats